MRLNRTVVILAIAKRDTDSDAKYDEAMEEIESRKTVCKGLEYAGHVTGLVTNLIDDIPEIPLVTDTIKLIAAGVAAVFHIAEFGMNIAATALECDDVNFDEIKLIMDKRFNELDRKLDKMTEALEKVTQAVSITLKSVEKTREEMKWGFKNVLATLKNQEIQAILSKINKFSRYFEEKKDEISVLRADQFVFRLKEEGGILDYLKTARMPEGLHSDLFELMDKNNNFAIPEDANDTKAFQALYALFYGTQTYASIMFFLLKQHSYLADYYYQRGQDKEFNDEFNILMSTFEDFKTSLTGNKGLINEVVKTLEDVKNKPFIKYVNDELYKDISKRVDGLHALKSDISKMVLNVIEVVPEPVANLKFDGEDIASNYGDWNGRVKISYAVQLRVDGTYSKFSDWTEPLKIDGKANPTLQVPRDEKGRERIVFRRFNNGKPQLAAILSRNQGQFRDIDRDLYDAARSKDQTRPLEYIPILLKENANIKATFEMGRSIMHAAAESGNVKIAMRFLRDEALFNARDDKGFTPMHIAAATKNAGFVSFLVDQNADVNAQTNVDKLTPLHIASKYGFIKTVKNLLESDKIEINKPEKSGYTALHYAVRSTKRTIEMLLADSKIDVNARSDFGFTPFHLAVMKGSREICDALLSSGKVEVNAGNKNNMTPLHFASMAGNVDMIQYLLLGKKGVEEIDINTVTSDNNWTSLYFAVYFKNENAALELLRNKKIDVSITSKENYTPMHLSIATGQMKIFDELLGKEINIESLTKERFTALHLAVLRPETDFTLKLLDKNANINAQTDDGSTPLHLALKSDKTDQVILLINRGVNMKLRDSKNFFPLHYAIKNVNLEVLRAAVKNDPSIYDLETEEGKELAQFCVKFVFTKARYYYLNKDSVEYIKYKDVEPLEVFKQMGYYDLLRIVKNDPSPESEETIDKLMRMADALGRVCMENEKDPNKDKCAPLETFDRARRNIKTLDYNEYHHSSELQPINYLQSNFNNFKNIDDSNSFATKPKEDFKPFSYSKNSIIQNVDTNGMLLLFDLLIRKFTNEKYNTNNGKGPMSSLESQAKSLEIIDKFSSFVNSITDVPAEELMDLAKLHSDLFKAIEGENNIKIFDLLCNHLKEIVVPEQIAAFLSSIIVTNGDQNQENFIAQYCLSKVSEEDAF